MSNGLEKYLSDTLDANSMGLSKYYCPVCKRNLPVLAGVITHDKLPHPETDGVNTQTEKFGLTFSPEKQGRNYISYDQLTEAQVVSWSKQELGLNLVTNTEALLVNMLTATPAPLPWA